MTDTKELLRSAIGGATPAVPDLERVLRRAAARRRRERLVAGGLALLLTAGLGIGVVLASRGGSGQGPSDAVDVFGPTRAVLIPSESMSPTLEPGDTVWVDEGAYRSGRLPARGDVIAFDVPGMPGSEEFVKRVVGLPGDVVEQGTGPVIFVNGVEFQFPPQNGDDPRHLGPWTVLPGHVFVIGDNVVNSNDSRYAQIGQVPYDHIIGKVVEVLSPDDRRATIAPPPAGSAPGPGSPTG